MQLRYTLNGPCAFYIHRIVAQPQIAQLIKILRHSFYSTDNPRVFQLHDGAIIALPDCGWLLRLTSEANF